MVPETEREMVLLAEEYLSSKDIDYAIEVPFLHRSIDLVYRFQNELVAVEFKRVNWKRALKQAKDHVLGAERVYICMPDSRITDEIKARAQELGIGVYAWSGNEPMLEVVPAARSSLLWDVSQRWLWERFKLRREQTTTNA